MPNAPDSTPIAWLLLFRFSLVGKPLFRFFHSPTVYAFLHARLGTRRDQAFPPFIRFLAVENGRVKYSPGDVYHIAIALLPNPDIGVRQLIERLRMPGGPITLEGTPLSPRTSLLGVTDLVGGTEIMGRGDAKPLTLGHIRTNAGQLFDKQAIHLRLDSPLLILRQPVQRCDTYLDGESCDAGVLLNRIGQAAQTGWPAIFDNTVVPPSAHIIANHLLRAETYYRGRDSNSAGKILPGAIGQVIVGLDSPLGEDWALRMQLAGLFGAGKSTAMGQGRFHVEDVPLNPQWPPPAARTFCQRMTRDDILAKARDSLGRAGATPGVDAVERDDFLQALTYRLPLLREALACGEHRPSPLRGMILSRPDGKIRPLAIPTVEDRFLQRAAVEELSPAIDEILEESSFAYRRGLSRRNAESHVRRAHDDGFCHVLEADLRAFFDRVDWQLLHGRLEAYLGKDPAVAQLMRWVEAPVEFGGQIVQRKQGLPQGAVISPMLANLYLDSFDEAIASEGFRLVRYADDFVVLCKSPEEAQRARDVVEREVARLKLELAGEKTGLTTFERGFEFLGFLFAHSLSLEKKPKPRASHAVVDPEGLKEMQVLDPDAARGWLVDWLGTLPAQGDPEIPSFKPALAPTSPSRRAVYVVQPGYRLTGSRRGLRVYNGETLIEEVAWSTISEVAVLGQRAMGPSLFQQAMHNRVPVSLFTRAGKPIGIILPDRVRTPSQSTRTHWQWNEDREARMRVARVLVESKIHNQRLLARHQIGDNTDLRERLAQLAGQATRAERTESLLGIEGAAAHAYFSAWHRWLPEELGFQQRSGRGARDPVNSLLNLLYTQLFHRCWLGCIAQGLDPFLGVLHEGNERYAALAADLQEPFRFLCDRLVLDLFHRNQLSKEDFIHQEKPEPLTRLKPDSLKLVLAEWERRLESRVRPESGTTHSYRLHIMTQAQRLAEVVRGERQDIGVFRLKW